MMPASYHGLGQSALTMPSYPQDAFLEELSRQMAMSQSTTRRYSRGSNSQQRCGNAMSTAMRVSKPSSANNSPRSATLAARRRTMMNDGTLAARRRQHIDQTTLPQSGLEVPHQQHTSRSGRPLSWHPSSYSQQYHTPMSVPQMHQYMNQYPFPSAAMPCHDQEFSANLQQPHYSPMPMAHSCSTSPNSAFSPLSLPYNNFDDSTSYLPVEGWPVQPQATPGYVASSQAPTSYAEPFPQMPANVSSSTQWNHIPSAISSVSPPTPENLPQAQQSQPAVSSGEVSFQALDKPEEEGEILIGMGLYDAPDKYCEDPHLNHSRSAMSSLLGSSFRGRSTEAPTGKGLKLEEAWQPPESDDEEEGDEEGGEQDENSKGAVQT